MMPVFQCPALSLFADVRHGAYFIDLTTEKANIFNCI
jgi:hypothetical protein